jgi:putative DNA methylase
MSCSRRPRTERISGRHENLGVAQDGVAAPLIDILHRILWLLENQPGKLGAFLRVSAVNLEQLRAVAEALRGPVLKRATATDSLTAELSALAKLTANWRSVVEDAVISAVQKEARAMGQPLLEYEDERKS